jgi:pimeloyl-ACP methyl ester carboxylesterase
MEVESGFADVNGTRLYYEAAGSGGSLVLIHGFTLNTGMWDDQFEEFAKCHRVVRYDARGYGRSAKPVLGETYSHEEDLNALLDFLGIERTAVLGLSMGGFIAVNFAIAYPDSTMALIPVDSSLLGHRWSKEFSDMLDEMYAKGREEGPEAAKRLFFSCPLFEPALERPLLASRLRRLVSAYSGWHFVNDDPRVQVLSVPAMQQLERIRAPTLVIVGE